MRLNLRKNADRKIFFFLNFQIFRGIPELYMILFIEFQQFQKSRKKK